MGSYPDRASQPVVLARDSCPYRCRLRTRGQAHRLMCAPDHDPVALPVLANAIFEYIEEFYNRRRRHSALDYMTPIQFETTYALNPVSSHTSP